MSSLHSSIFSATANASALRLIVRLKPANADGIVYPPTYEGGEHIFRPAWIDGKERQAVLLDSVQSQANRIELAILDAHRRGKINYPDIKLLVNASTGNEEYSVLELSHRVYDAALRNMSTYNEIPFAKSEPGKAIYAARAEKATGLFKHAPITLVLGGWDSHGGGGPLVAKLPRVITSEIIGLDAKRVQRGAGRIDPMDIRKDAGPIYRSMDHESLWETEIEKSADRKSLDPSKAGLGNIPPTISERGAVITEAVQTSLISLSAVRRLRFEMEDESYKDERDHAGQAVIVALALFGLLAQIQSGYCLRSGCDLFPIDAPKLEIIGTSLEKTELLSVTVKDALEALEKSLSDAKANGLLWREKALLVMASQPLRTMVERSRRATESEN